MKKLSFIALILLISAGGVNAQKVNTNSNTRHKVDQNVPSAVLAAVEANQPGLALQQQLMELTPVSKEKKIRKVKKIRKITSPPTQLYQVLTSGKNYKKIELYNEEGILIYSKESIRNTAMPLAVRQYIGREYDGWLVKRNMSIKKASKDGSQLKYYKVLVQNGKEKELVRINEQGSIYARELP